MAEPLNVVVVVLDSVRASHLSCYGYARATTPFLDGVAREGVRFTAVIAPAASTVPAHASLMTGRYPSSHGATEEQPTLAAPATLLPEHFRAAGYRTAAFCTTPSVSPETGFGRGFDAYFTQRYPNRLATRAVTLGRRAGDALLRRRDAGARRTNQAVCRWIAAGPEPFFAFVHYSEAHLPLDPPRPYDRAFLPHHVPAARTRSVNQDPEHFLAGGCTMAEEDVTVLTALYDGALRYLDARLAEMVAFLQARGCWERTVFVVTADHGEHLGEHGRFGHALGLHDDVLRVPLLIRCPTRVPQGFTVDELAQTTDILPTVVRLAGLTADTAGGEGRCLLEDGRVTQGPSFAVAERFRPELSRVRQLRADFDVRPHDVRLKAIRTKRMKFVWHSDEANELYDIATDPGETCNLVEQESERAEELRRELFDWLATVQRRAADGAGTNEAEAERTVGRVQRPA